MDHKVLPQARSENLIVEELDGEVLVYDIDRDRAHCLNSTAALVWKLCNGRRTPGDIARELQLTTETRDANDSTRAIKASALKGTDELVWLALDQLSRDHLLDDKTFTASRVPLISRREAIRRVGIGAAIA